MSNFQLSSVEMSQPTKFLMAIVLKPDSLNPADSVFYLEKMCYLRQLCGWNKNYFAIRLLRKSDLLREF